jgi:hypothetical protein
MKFIIIFLNAIVLFSTCALGQSKPVEMSNSGICHALGSTNYEQNKRFTPFKILQESLNAGGGMAKR